MRKMSPTWNLKRLGEKYLVSKTLIKNVYGIILMYLYHNF